MKISLKHYWASAELSLNLGQFTENALAILFAMVAFLVFLPGTVFAANYTVTNYSDSGAGSLRSAIEQSNSVTGPNTIIVPTGTYTLSSGPLKILNQVTIIGANGDLEGDAAKTIIQASVSVDTANTRVFDINPLQDAIGYNVALKALTIRNGNVGAGSPYGGAGIAADTGISTVTIYNCIVENNKSSYEGAGLHISGLAGGTFHMEKTVVHNNTAVGPGGGIFLEGDLNAAISLSSILNNASLSSQGGGMSIRPYIAAGIITITSSTITGNSAAGTDVGQGGGIYLNSPAAITDTMISGNVSDLDGGGVYYANYGPGTLTLSNTIFDNNSTIQLGRTKDLYIHTGEYVNAAPIITSPGSILVTEDVACPLTGISFSDIDSGSAAVTATFNVSGGALSATSGGGVTITGAGTGTLTLTGTVSDISAFIATGQIAFTTAANSTESVTLTIGINDGGKTGSGGAKTDSSTVTLTVTAVNDVPIVTASSDISVTENLPSPLTGISFSDVDAGSNGSETMTLSVPSGTLSAISSGGVTVTGAGTGTLTLTGTVSDINAFIAAGQIAFTTAANSTESVTLTIGVNDGGNTGSGGALTASKTVTLTVTAVNNAPTAKSVVPTQSITGTGTVSFTASDIAEDVDSGDILTITDIMTAPESAKAKAVLLSGTVTVTGVASGSTSVVVRASDGNASVNVTVPITVAPPTAYALTITAGTGGAITTGSSGNYPEGSVVSISATATSDYKFYRWTAVGGGTFADSSSASTSFTMPAANVTVMAEFEAIPPTPTSPVISSITPSSGPESGGITVTINGSGFTGATVVNFGTALGTNLTVISDTSITVTSPAGTGTIDVTVTTPDGTSAKNLSDEFTYTSASTSLISITTPSAITGVANGTEKTAAALGLPLSVVLVTGQGNVSANISWDVNASSYDVTTTTEQTFSVSGTVSLPAGVVNPNSVALTTTISVTVNAATTVDKTLMSIAAPSDIVGVANGTAKTAVALGLTTSVILVTDHGSVNANVSWDVSASSYDVAATTEQTFSVTGTVSLPAGVVNPSSIALTTTINVTVDAATTMDKILVSITTPSAITGVANGIEKTALALGLPSNVVLVTDHGSVNANVSWDVSASSYDVSRTTEQTFSVTGSVSLPAGMVNPNSIDLTTTISVTVDEATTVDKTLISITTPSAITFVANGTEKTAAALGLPTSVALVTDQGSVNTNVSWDVNASTYDVSRTTEQTFSVSGTVSLPAGVVNPNSVALTITISVTVNAATTVDKTLMSITDPSDIVGVANGTAKTAVALGLPTSVVLVTDQGSVNANVSWDVNASAYDVAATTEQTFSVTGTVSLPAGVVNPSSIALTTTINVTVDAATTTDKTLISITPLSAITGVANGTAKTALALGLPSNVVLVTDNGNVNANVSWDVNTSSYVVTRTTEQTFSVTGTVSLPAGVVNPNSVALTTTISVTVNAATSSGGDSGGSSGGSSGSTTTVTGDVTDSKTGQIVRDIEARVTAGKDGKKTIEINSKEAIVFQQPNSTHSSVVDLSKLGFSSTTNPDSEITLTADGILQIKNLANGTDSNFTVTYDLGNGQRITIGTIEAKVGSDGKVSLSITLIDPYGIITDPTTGQPIVGVDVTLYYANTERNFRTGKTPDTMVQLPILDGFKPNNNKNPQVSDASGAYGFMVFPTSDYYIVATKEGYEAYKSPTISVEQDIVKWDFKMNQSITGVKRLAGLTSVDTALEIAKANYTTKLSNVVLATAENYPDALAGSVLAYKLNAPILLVGNTEVDQEKIIAYLKSNLEGKGTVYILGGTAVVSAEMEAKVMASGFNQIIRLGGTDRYETAVKIADQLEVQSGTPIVLVYGENYPDALSISSIAAGMQSPILLVQKEGLSKAVQETIAEIKPIKVYIIGGEGVISTAAENQVAQITSLDRTNIVRISGEDRYETSLAVAQYFNLSGQSVCIATGKNFPDALAGSVYAANFNAPIILAEDSLSDQVINFLETRTMTGVTLFGGEAVISKDIEQQLRQLLGK